jgi:hypothetical protein
VHREERVKVGDLVASVTQTRTKPEAVGMPNKEAIVDLEHCPHGPAEQEISKKVVAEDVEKRLQDWRNRSTISRL